VCEEPDAIECPVYAVAGLAEGYRNTVPRLLERLRAPVRGLVGPWAHLHPDLGRPGPAVGFVAESLRFWDRWLRGIDIGSDDEPALRVYLQHATPSAVRGDVPGHWIAEPAWPSPNVDERAWVLNAGRLDPDSTARAEQTLVLAPDQTTGLAGGLWCPMSLRDLPAEQGRDDARSLVFDAEALGEPLEIVGFPRACLEVAVDRPLAFVSVRLTDVDREGRSWLVTRGVLNLTHRDGSASPDLVPPGERLRALVPLDFAAHRFGEGHRLRLSISTSDWPLIWPSPRPVRLTLFSGASRLHLPVRAPRPGDGIGARFEPPATADPGVTLLRPGSAERRVEVDASSGCQLIHSLQDSGVYRLDAIGTGVSRRTEQRSRGHPDDPLRARFEIETASRLERAGWDVRVTASTTVEGTQDELVLRARLVAAEGERELFSRSWNERVPRRFF
jgi:predicted acyl esterase